jgi:hypothetical protein
MPREFHVCLDIRGYLLNFTKASDYDGLLTDSSGRPLGPIEAKVRLLEELSKGHKKLPCGPCDGFSYEHGCPGHEIAKGE